jgi:hypothetical protein
MSNSELYAFCLSAYMTHRPRRDREATRTSPTKNPAQTVEGVVVVLEEDTSTPPPLQVSDDAGQCKYVPSTECVLSSPKEIICFRGPPLPVVSSAS